MQIHRLPKQWPASTSVLLSLLRATAPTTAVCQSGPFWYYFLHLINSCHIYSEHTETLWEECTQKCTYTNNSMPSDSWNVFSKRRCALCKQATNRLTGESWVLVHKMIAPPHSDDPVSHADSNNNSDFSPHQSDCGWIFNNDINLKHYVWSCGRQTVLAV